MRLPTANAQLPMPLHLTTKPLAIILLPKLRPPHSTVFKQLAYMYLPCTCMHQRGPMYIAMAPTLRPYLLSPLPSSEACTSMPYIHACMPYIHACMPYIHACMHGALTCTACSRRVTRTCPGTPAAPPYGHGRCPAWGCPRHPWQRSTCSQSYQPAGGDKRDRRI